MTAGMKNDLFWDENLLQKEQIVCKMTHKEVVRLPKVRYY